MYNAVRNRMKSVKNIQKITKAMKMVAASKLRQIQTKAENSRGLWQPFTALLGDTPSMLFHFLWLDSVAQLLLSSQPVGWWVYLFIVNGNK